MNHTSKIRLPGVSVWSECMAPTKERSYAIASQPMTLPTLSCSPGEAHQKLGISTIAFNNPDGHLVATKNDSMPTTVWIWSVKLLRPFAVLVHLSPVKSISWHPTIPDLLMVLCENEGRSNGVIYLWNSKWKEPRIITTPMETVSAQFGARWMFTPKPSNSATASNGTSGSSSTGSLVSDRRSRSPEKECDKMPTIMFGDRDGFMIGHVEDEEVDEDSDDANDHSEDEGYGYITEKAEKRPWNPRDWAFFNPSQRTSSPTQSQNTSGGSMAQTSTGTKAEASGKASASREEDGYRQHRRQVSVK